MRDEDNCDPAYGTDWADTDIMSVIGAAKAGIPGAIAQLEKLEKELLLSGIDVVGTDKSADITKNNPNRDPRTGQFTYGAGGPQAGGSGGAGGEGGGEGGASGQGEETDYRGYHQAPTRADGFGSPATDVEEMMPDFYERPGIYTTGYPDADKESVSVLTRIKGKPDATVTIYRAVPEGAEEINPGDWVTLSPSYAKSHLMSNVEAGHVISMKIPARDLWFDGNSINEFGYDPVPTGKSADILKNNPNRDPRTGQFTYGAGGPQSGGSGGGGADGEDAEGSGGAGGADGETDGAGEMTEGKDITSELGRDYGQVSESKLAQELRLKQMEPGTRGDPVLDDIAKRQGFDGGAELVDQKTFDDVVAKGGTVTYRGITPHYDGPGAGATFIEGESATTDSFAEGKYFAGQGVYGGGTYTATDLSTAQHYATEDDAGGSVVTMAIKPGAKIATPKQWLDAREAAKDGKGGFMGADDPGRILAAQGYDGYKIVARNIDDPATNFIVVLNRTALVVLDK
jgi:hypothetical protein